MNPFELVAAAIAVGALAGQNPSTPTAVKDAYAALKTLIARRYSSIDIRVIESRPTSELRRAAIIEDLMDSRIEEDQELLALAQNLLEMTQYDETSQPAIGIELQGINAESLRVENVVMSGTGVRVRSVRTSGDISIKGINPAER